jgi:ABC-2 type transport system ATP-binding protein
MTGFAELKNLRKQYNPPDGPFAVGQEEGVNLTIEQGEIFSLLGPNGAGKSTIINVMSGLLTPTAGDVIIGGHSIRENPLEVKRLIGVVPQDLALYPRLSARQNLEFFGKLYGLRGKDLKQRSDEILELISLTDRANDKIGEYSGGMKRRVNIGVGLMNHPQMLFLDEPTVGIDPQSRRAILDTVSVLNKEQGITILYTTHYMEEAQELSNRIGIIDHGQIIALGTLDELTATVGQYDTVSLLVPQATPEVVQQLNDLPNVERSENVNGEIRLIAVEGRAVLPEAIRILNEAGLTLNALEVQEPNLEAVFLHLTGRALRD